MISEGFWSEWRGSNSRPRGPKPMSEPSGRTESHSLALSVAPTVPLWNFFALFVSGTAFGFWDLYGMKFCILKVLPTRFTSDSRCFLPQRAAQKLHRINKNKHSFRGFLYASGAMLILYQQRNKRDDKESAG